MDTPMVRKRLRELHEPDRMFALSDGVIAVAITLLVLDLKVPESTKGADDAVLRHDLMAMLPNFEMYALSFFVVGLAWLGHHRKFAHVRRVDAGLLWLNLLFLMSVALVPFVTAFQSQSTTRTAVILYSGTLCITMALSAAMSAYVIQRPELFDTGTPRAVQRSLLLSPLLSAAVFALSMVLGFVDTAWSRYALLLLVPCAMYSGAREPDGS